MAFIHWQDFMATGNDKIDRGHREILTLINRLGEAIEAGKWQCARIVGLRLFLEVGSHFALEEEMMATHGYPGLDAHRRLHACAETQMGQLDSALCWTEVSGADVARCFADFTAQFNRDFFEADLHMIAYLARTTGAAVSDPALPKATSARPAAPA